MNTQANRIYEYKVFKNGQLKQLALRLARFCNISPSDGFIFLHYKDDEFDTSTIATVDELENICEIGNPLDTLSFHYNNNVIQFSLSLFLKAFSVTYIIDGDIEYSKKLIFFVENTLELTRISNELTKEHSKHDDARDNSEANESEGLFDNDPSNLSDGITSTNSLVTVWHKASNQLRLLLPAAAYQTWIAPILPRAEGNQLILNCPNEFAKDWVETRFKKDVIETVQSIEPSVEGIIIQVGSKGVTQSNEVITNCGHLQLNTKR